MRAARLRIRLDREPFEAAVCTKADGQRRGRLLPVHACARFECVGGLCAEGGISGFIELPQSASPVEVEVKNESGQVVRTIDLGSQSAGRVSFEWDGNDASGDRLPPGDYTLSCNIVVDGTPQAAQVLMSAAVQSVTLSGYDILLNLAGGSQIPFGQVNEIL